MFASYCWGDAHGRFDICDIITLMIKSRLASLNGCHGDTWEQIKFAVVCFHVMNGLLFIDPPLYQLLVAVWCTSLGRRCPSINRWRVRNVRGGLRWPRWLERKYHIGIYFVFFWLKLAVFMVIWQYWKAPILYMLYEILWVVIVILCTQKNQVLCIQLSILQSYSTTNL